MEKLFILAGDIGGTKTDLALYPLDSEGVKTPQRKMRYPSQNYGALEEIVSEYLTVEGTHIERACFGVAGPVVRGRAEITNLTWLIEAHRLEPVLEAPVTLINDMDAIANAVAHVTGDDLKTLLPGTPLEGGARGIIAPGTGLGEGFLVWAGDRYLPYGSEGGHTDFAPRGELQVALLLYLEARFGHISYERVCSGIGLPNLYAFLKDTGRHPEPHWLGEALRQAPDRTPLIVQAALDGRAEICEATLDLFTAILGSEAGNLALKLMATGGIYLAGGIPRRILPWLSKPQFREFFIDKGRFAEILSRIPVHVLLNPDAALLGAAWRAFEEEAESHTR